MDNFEIQDCLDSMQVIIDTREQPSIRADKRFKSFECPYKRQTLSYGDYTYNFRKPNGAWLHEEGTTLEPEVVIERKMSLGELSGNFCQGRKRFQEEFSRAKENNASVYLLVENATWENLFNGKYGTKFNPKAYKASIFAFIARYGIHPIFCKEETSGQIIKEILYRELKERLERGEYDNQ